MSDITILFNYLENMRRHLKDSIEEAEKAKKISAELSGSFEQEISTDLEELQANIREIFDNLESVISEAKTLRKDFNELETSLRAGLSDEENYKINSEHIQDGKRQEREEEKQDV